jgi:hypothetical protein
VDDVERVLAEKTAELRELPDLEVVRCGNWLWVSGNTKEHKDRLKELGLRWAPKKGKWYFAGTPRRGGKKTMDWSYIREKYGEELIQEAI